LLLRPTRCGRDDGDEDDDDDRARRRRRVPPPPLRETGGVSGVGVGVGKAARRPSALADAVVVVIVGMRRCRGAKRALAEDSRVLVRGLAYVGAVCIALLRGEEGRERETIAVCDRGSFRWVRELELD
jgi:hypothetical protein